MTADTECPSLYLANGLTPIVPLTGNGAEGIRTPDLVSAIHALSHLSYSPLITDPSINH